MYTQTNKPYRDESVPWRESYYGQPTAYGELCLPSSAIKPLSITLDPKAQRRIPSLPSLFFGAY